MDTSLRISLRSRQHCTAHARAALAVALFLGAMAAAQLAWSAAPIAHSCAQVEATVTAPSQGEARGACEAVAQAVSFMAGQGMPLVARIDLQVVESLPKAESTATRGGVYLHSEQRAYVLRRARWSAGSTPFGLPMTTALYRSIIVHEVAHAIAATHFRVQAPDVTAHEYIAYVAQMASLPPTLRARIVNGFPGSDREADARFNLIVLGMNPDRFAALAWQHWHEPENGAGFLDHVLAGRVLRGG